ncbi:MAG: hypothetical protein P8Y78_01460 [Acidihalobacter sp.]|jgi:hypothetical protein
MQPRPTERKPRFRLVLAAALCGLLAHGGSAFAARGADGNGGGGTGSSQGGTSAGGSAQSGDGAQSDGTSLNSPDTALLPEPIKLQALLERHHLTRSRVLDAEIDRKGGLWVYELKLLDPDGVVRELRYNALNGDALPHNHD